METQTQEQADEYYENMCKHAKCKCPKHKEKVFTAVFTQANVRIMEVHAESARDVLSGILTFGNVLNASICDEKAEEYLRWP